MDLEKYTDRSKGFLQNAEKLASRNNNQYLVPAHLLKVMLEDNEGMAANLLTQSGANVEQDVAQPSQQNTEGMVEEQAWQGGSTEEAYEESFEEQIYEEAPVEESVESYSDGICTLCRKQCSFSNLRCDKPYQEGLL